MIKTWLKHKMLEKAIHTMFDGWCRATTKHKSKKMEDYFKIGNTFDFIGTVEYYKEATVHTHLYNCQIVDTDLPYDFKVFADTYYKFEVRNGKTIEQTEIHNISTWVEVDDIVQQHITLDFKITT